MWVCVSRMAVGRLSPNIAVRSSGSAPGSIEIAGTSVKLVTWEETATDGEMTAHYGISLDGQSIALINPTSYELGLRYARFDPTDGEPAIEPAAY